LEDSEFAQVSHTAKECPAREASGQGVNIGTDDLALRHRRESMHEGTPLLAHFLPLAGLAALVLAQVLPVQRVAVPAAVFSQWMRESLDYAQSRRRERSQDHTGHPRDAAPVALSSACPSLVCFALGNNSSRPRRRNLQVSPAEGSACRQNIASSCAGRGFRITKSAV